MVKNLYWRHRHTPAPARGPISRCRSKKPWSKWDEIFVQAMWILPEVFNFQWNSECVHIWICPYLAKNCCSHVNMSIKTLGAADFGMFWWQKNLAKYPGWSKLGVCLSIVMFILYVHTVYVYIYVEQDWVILYCTVSHYCIMYYWNVFCVLKLSHGIVLYCILFCMLSLYYMID
jgi:hypothetical protein